MLQAENCHAEGCDWRTPEVLFDGLVMSAVAEAWRPVSHALGK